MKTAVLIFLCSASSALCQVGASVDSLTVMSSAGREMTFSHCQVIKVEPDGVRVVHDGGVAKIPFESLPQAWKAAAGIDASNAVAYRMSQETRPAAPPKAPAAPPAPANIPAKAVETQVAVAKPVPVRVFGLVVKPKRYVPDGLFLVQPFVGGGLIYIEGSSWAYRGNPRFETNVYPTQKSRLYDGVSLPVYTLTP